MSQINNETIINDEQTETVEQEQTTSSETSEQQNAEAVDIHTDQEDATLDGTSDSREQSEAHEETNTVYSAVVDQALNHAGIKPESLQTEWEDNQGNLTEDTYNKLVDTFGAPIVESYLKGLTIQTEQREKEAADFVQDVYKSVGGQSEYQNMMHWAQDNIEQEAQEKFNSALDSDNLETVYWAVKALHNEYKSTFGKTPNLITGSAPSTSSANFSNRDDLLKAMKSHEYNSNPKFREMVTRKLMQSEF